MDALCACDHVPGRAAMRTVTRLPSQPDAGGSD
jgi:hypothetical protein